MEINVKSSGFFYNSKVKMFRLLSNLNFHYDFDNKGFKLDEDPFGEGSLIDISNVYLNNDSNQLCLSAFYRGEEEKIVLKSDFESDKEIFKVISIFKSDFSIENDKDQFEIVFASGVFSELRINKYDGNNYIGYLTIIKDGNKHFVIKQNPWKKIELDKIQLLNNEIHYWIDSEKQVYTLNLNETIYELFEKIFNCIKL